MPRRALSFLTAVFFASTPAYTAPMYFLATDQTGAQTQIDVNHTSSWTLTPSSAFDLGGGLFVMKDGTSTSTTVSLTLYVAGTVTMTNAAFCAQVSNCGKFNTHQFLFTSPIPLTVGTTYFATLTSPAPDWQSEAYFIKNDFYFILGH